MNLKTGELWLLSPYVYTIVVLIAIVVFIIVAEWRIDGTMFSLLTHRLGTVQYKIPKMQSPMHKFKY